MLGDVIDGAQVGIAAGQRRGAHADETGFTAFDRPTGIGIKGKPALAACLLITASSPGSKMGILPLSSICIFAASLSVQTT